MSAEDARDDIGETFWAHIDAPRRDALVKLYGLYPQPQTPEPAHGDRQALTPKRYPRMLEIAVRAIRRLNWDEASAIVATLTRDGVEKSEFTAISKALKP